MAVYHYAILILALASSGTFFLGILFNSVSLIFELQALKRILNSNFFSATALNCFIGGSGVKEESKDCTSAFDRCVNITTSAKAVTWACNTKAALELLGAEDGKCKESNTITYCVCDKDNCNSASTQSIVQMFTMIITTFLTKTIFV